MKPYFETELGKLYHGDCLEIMPQLEPVDLVITSPEYNINNTSGGGIKGATNSGLWKSAKLANGYIHNKDNISNRDYVKKMKLRLSLMWDTLNDSGAIYYNHKPRPQKEGLLLPLEHGSHLPLKQIIIWHRKSGINFNDTHYLPTYEFILLYAKEKFRLKKKGCKKTDLWAFPPESKNDHPAPFPVLLPMNILLSTNNGSVLDPHLGSGTTAIACERLKRCWIGIEIEEKYCEIAAKRIELENKQMKLF
jgi:modification methylase